MMRSLSEHVIRRLNAKGLHEDIPTINLVADILQICHHWCNRPDDAIRIPDALHETEKEVRKTARSLSFRRDDKLIAEMEAALDDWTPQEENNERGVYAIPHSRKVLATCEVEIPLTQAQEENE